MLNGMALFAGIGGIEIGLRKWIRTVCYVEKESYAVAVLRSHIENGEIDNAPIWDDVNTFQGQPWNGLVDVVTGGFPCQDISYAGKGKGIKSDTRSGLWFQMFRIINEVQPAFVFVENVSALTNRGLDIVLGQLSEAGYDARWTNLRASDVGARHRRERMFILAYTHKHGKPTMPFNDKERPRKLREYLAHSECCGHIHGQSQEQPAEAWKPSQRDIKPKGNVAYTKHTRFNAPQIGRGTDKGSNDNQTRKEQPSKLEGLCYEQEDVANDKSNGHINRKGSSLKGAVGFITECSDVVADTRSDSCRDIENETINREDKRIRPCREGWESRWHQDPAELSPSSKSFVGRVAYGIPNRVDRIKCLGNAVVPEQAERAWEILTNMEVNQ